MKTLILSSAVAICLAAFTTADHSTAYNGTNKMIKDTTVPGSDTSKKMRTDTPKTQALPPGNPTGASNPANPLNDGSMPVDSGSRGTMPLQTTPATTPGSPQNPYGTSVPQTPGAGNPQTPGSGNMPSTPGIPPQQH